VSFVVDTSALMAVILEERGAEAVFPHLRGAKFSSVNLSETASRVAEKKNTTAGSVIELLKRFELDVRPFDNNLALKTAELRPHTRARGISLADRACLALALEERLPILTADTDWLELDLDLDIRLIR
jgi:PIN domain nuclease of toxin-antitoxin system